MPTNVHRSITNFSRSFFIAAAHFTRLRVERRTVMTMTSVVHGMATNQIEGAEIILIWSDFLLVSRLRSFIHSFAIIIIIIINGSGFTADNCNFCVSSLRSWCATNHDFMIFQSANMRKTNTNFQFPYSFIIIETAHVFLIKNSDGNLSVSPFSNGRLSAAVIIFDFDRPFFI